ncbi:ELWxxDGT repeat protein [Hyalangium rubrum]|uniref:ELWxxDGT repeat protein n=1 Tax=Hyalangium rubrum TaxID=3103134 RepID=A0ABU5H895_9BACT|nr:ELWxxDGT repeat protein [Hyalangium sp. s54d21]MDY7229078.1 ELWxxDGT repeat protein [Hyalangium sp. s54d21]
MQRATHPRLFLLLLVAASFWPWHRAAALGSTQPCAAPVVVRDIAPGADSSFISELVDVNGTLFFAADDGVSGVELWRSDGTEAGTQRVADIRPGGANASPRELTAVGSTLFFLVPLGPVGLELWKSDGTDVGTVRLKSFPDMVPALNAELTAVGSTLFFVAYEGPNDDVELWKSDGTPSGTVRVKDIAEGLGGSYPTGLTAMGNLLFFSANGRDSSTGDSGYELWKSDGTDLGTLRVADLAPGIESSFPGELTPVGQTLFFTAVEGSATGNAKLWKSNGTGVTLVKDFTGPNDPSPQDLEAMGNTLFFVLEVQGVSGKELWKSDGTGAGTVIVKDIQAGNSGSDPQTLTAMGNTLFFVANDGVSGLELWRSDGTRDGTRLVKDIVPMGNPPDWSLTPGPGMLLMSLDDLVSGNEPWRSDGTPEGTFRMADLMPAGSSSPHGFVLSGQSLFFVATDPSRGEELFVLPFGGVDCSTPSLACPGDLEVEAVSSQGTVVSYPPATVLDDALSGLTVNYSLPSGHAFGVGAQPVSVTARDLGGNRNMCTFQVRVNDTTPPLLLCPERVQQEATSAAGAVANYFVVASDAVSSTVALEYSQAPGTTFPIQTTLVEVVARDAALKESRCTFPVEIRDTTAPRLTCPPDVARVVTSAEELVVTYEPQVEEAVSPPQVSASHPSGSTFPVGDTLVTLSSEDVAGNSSQCTFRVNLIDRVDPSITCPGPQYAKASTEEGAVVSFSGVSATDNLTEPEVSYSPAFGSTLPLGETVVTATASDAGGKTASCTFTVTVELSPEAPKSGCQSGPGGAASLAWVVLMLLPVWARRRAR